MKSAIQFFIQYYVKKHIGFLWGASISAKDIFWKNYFRVKASMPIELLEESGEKLLVQSSIDDHQFRCYIRCAPSSDIFVFRQIFESKEYKPLLEIIQKNKDIDVPLLIVDAGANVGYTAFFLNCFFGCYRDSH